MKHISNHKSYESNLDKLHQLKLTRETKKERLSREELKLEEMKRASIQSNEYTWQDVEDKKSEMEKLRYQIKYLSAQIADQEEKVEQSKQNAREVINQYAKEAKLDALRKAVEGYNLVIEAFNDYQSINSEQIHALDISAGERRKIHVADIACRVPHPFMEAPNDIWYKQAREYLANQEEKIEA